MVQKESKTRQPRRNFTDEFKKEAAELAGRIGIKQAAEELGIHSDNVARWKRDFNPQVKNNQKTYAELEKENKRLFKENGYLKKINEVLKKSTAIFSTDHMGNFK